MRQRLRPTRRPSAAQWRAVAIKGLGLVLAWLLVAVPVSLLVFLSSSRGAVIASHHAVVTPRLDGFATVELGPYLPSLRYPAEGQLGVRVDLGSTTLQSYNALIQRYAFIASQPEGQVAKLRAVLTDMAVDSAVTGGLVGLAAPGLWLLLGRRRRVEIVRQVTVQRVAVGTVLVALVTVVAAQPWNGGAADFTEPVKWQPIDEALPDVPIPAPARLIEVEQGLMTQGTKRLAASAFDTYTKSLRFYTDVAADAQELSPLLRQPEEGETVAILVSDRHDNIGMDKVARAIADAAGATVLLDAGDDTSTGSAWEAFSLESLDAAFSDFENRYSVAGNHDNGDFVSEYFAELGFTTLHGEAVDGPEGSRMLGVNDPRSSGLGTWREAVGMSFHEHEQALADLVCEHHEDGDRIDTLLVHDANTGREALARGCVDLVLAGHVHAQLGPTLVIGENGSSGYTYTNGTTGGAAYAVAIGSKLRRDAMVTLVTYRDGSAVGIQPVTIRTVGDFRVGDYIALDVQQEFDETAPHPGEPSVSAEPEPLPEDLDGETGPGAETSPGTGNGPPAD